VHHNSERPEWQSIVWYLQARLRDPVQLLHVAYDGTGADPHAYASQEAAAFACFLARHVPRLHITTRSLAELRAEVPQLADDAPAFLVATDGGWRIRYLGVPLGSELQPFLEALVLLSRQEAPFPPVTLSLLQKLAPVRLGFYFTPT
jgi:hypothetical protein